MEVVVVRIQDHAGLAGMNGHASPAFSAPARISRTASAKRSAIS
ncbi:hypothetical protein BZL30_6647 [Mycobacterium kansasii]|uniref:Uncharacterized protein n=1 Tax=Mycobacterium kansasii TaxID=1768 RepID=A0A1V3WTT7_MYCKA|nr:hypothetical protein BZL30_6647 [Mycobacterium kansasii]